MMSGLPGEIIRFFGVIVHFENLDIAILLVRYFEKYNRRGLKLYQLIEDDE